MVSSGLHALCTCLCILNAAANCDSVPFHTLCCVVCFACLLRIKQELNKRFGCISLPPPEKLTPARSAGTMDWQLSWDFEQVMADWWRRLVTTVPPTAAFRAGEGDGLSAMKPPVAHTALGQAIPICNGLHLGWSTSLPNQSQLSSTLGRTDSGTKWQVPMQ